MPWQGYKVNPLKAGIQLLILQRKTLLRLCRIYQPILIIQAKLDKTVDLRSGEIILQGIQSAVRESHCLEKSKHVVIVGRSNIVGKPIMALLSQKFEIGNATVTICHTGTKNIENYTKQADILIVAVGQAKYVNADMIKKGVHILDVGINRVSDNSEKGYKIVGDVNYDSVFPLVKSITPVPGGIGPMTITMLLKNTVEAASRLNKIINTNCRDSVIRE